MSTTVVVGHGTSPEGKGWGWRIGEAHRVVRMWNWHYQCLRPQDYGLKYDWGFYEILPTELSRFYKYNRHTPLEGWFASKVSQPAKIYIGELPGNSIISDSVALEQKAYSLGGMGTKGRIRLTRGVRAAACVVDRCMYRGDTLVLVGFDNAYAGIGLPVGLAFPTDYMADPSMFPLRGYTGGTTKYSNHDYAVERPLLEALAAEAGVELKWAQEYWHD